VRTVRENFAGDCAETSASVLESSDIIYVARVPSRRIMTVRINVGTRFPAYATSMGKVLLSELTPAELDAHLEGATLTPLTSWTITSRKALDRELARVRQRGWAIADQELEAGLRSIAVPVRDRSGVIIAAVNVSTTTTRHTLESLEQNLLPLLEIAVARIRSDYATARAYAQGRSGHGLTQ
jgi:IclR family transcriptional regulator, pca regulon regulatory protein